MKYTLRTVKKITMKDIVISAAAWGVITTSTLREAWRALLNISFEDEWKETQDVKLEKYFKKSSDVMKLLLLILKNR